MISSCQPGSFADKIAERNLPGSSLEHLVDGGLGGGSGGLNGEIFSCGT